MMNIDLPKGNGRQIFIDPKLLNINESWINDDLQAVVIPEIDMSESTVLYQLYRDLFLQFYEKGYRIQTDCTKITDDTFFFTPCLDDYATKQEYLAFKEKKIDECLRSSGVKRPITLSFPKDSFPTVLLELPFVLKNIESQGGDEKFLISTSEQLDILKRFYDEINLYARERSIKRAREQWSFLGHLEFDENGRSNKGISIGKVDYKKIFHNYMVMQEFIETPTRYNTSLRVLTSASGDILCSSLKYAESSLIPKKKYYGFFDQYLADTESPYYLDSQSIVSNTVAGGNSILLDRGNYTLLEKDILCAHGIDENKGFVPEQVANAALQIAVLCQREIGAICGMDFIYDVNEHIWKYLEEHEYPMLSSYAEKYDLPYDTSVDKFYETSQVTDIDARVRALKLSMYKR